MFVSNTFTATVTNNSTIHDLLNYSEITHTRAFETRVELSQDVRTLLKDGKWSIHFQDDQDCVLWDGQNTFVHYFNQKYVIKEETIDNTKMGGWIETIHEEEFDYRGDASAAVLRMISERRETNEELKTTENNLDKENDWSLNLNDGTTFYIVKK